MAVRMGRVGSVLIRLIFPCAILGTQFLAPAILNCQPKAAPPKRQPHPSAPAAQTPLPSPDYDEKDRAQRDREAFEKISDYSQKMNDMILLIIAGSIAVLVGTSYVHPKGNLRWPYILFPAGWCFLGLSMYHGLQVRASYLAYLISPRANSRLDWVSAINHEIALQVDLFQIGLTAFAIWLVLYVFWWIINPKEKEDELHV
jgi:hypothetical protein